MTFTCPNCHFSDYTEDKESFKCNVCKKIYSKDLYKHYGENVISQQEATAFIEGLKETLGNDIPWDKIMQELEDLE